MPTVRRRQRLSSSCTAPAERSPAISMRAMSLRISTGRSKCASVSRSPALKANGASPSGRPLRSSARTVPVSAAPAAARSTLTLSAPAALSAAVSAWAPGNAAGDNRDRTAARSPCAKLLDEFGAVAEIGAVGQPDQFGVLASRREARQSHGSASARSTVYGIGLHLMQPHARRTRGLQRNIARPLGQRNERHGAAIVLRARDDVVGGAHPRIPGRGGRPAVVDQDRERRARSGRRQAADATADRRRRR